MPGTAGNRPIFLCPGGNGSLKAMRRYQKLIHRLGNQRPLYGLVAADSDEAGGLYKDMGELVAASLSAMRHIQPHGPYMLIGESLGGKLAYEMARRLEKEGEQVAMLALLDAPSNGRGNLLQRLFNGWRGKAGGQRDPLAAYALQSKEVRSHLAQRRYFDILTKFTPSKRCSSPALAFFTHQYKDQRRRWEKLLPAVKIIMVAGVHDDYLRLSTGKVGEVLRQAMEGAPAPQRKAAKLR
jgi:pimeloyl-ACP methyl ester carboxylesterase